MNIILVSRKHSHARTLALGRRTLISLGVLMLLVLLGAGMTVYRLMAPLWFDEEYAATLVDPTIVDAWNQRLNAQRKEINSLKQHSTEQIDALTLRLGEMQARLMRLDALGQRLVEVAKLDQGEFSFDTQPALGGPIESQVGDSYRVPDLTMSLDQIQAQIDHRAQQLELLNDLFANRQFEAERFIAGRPITKGWLSSHFGYRSDPFSGRRVWHAGVDFAGKEGSDVVSVAAGVVTTAGDRGGYGWLVEINHGGGLVTRYAHCKELLVKVGDIVQKGQVIALMGSTGRSTGPHVHFEVLNNGRQVDPVKYINRASR